MLSPSQKPISTRSPSVLVEYDRRGERVAKRFEDGYAARRFYCSKLKQGLNPKVKKDVPNKI